ncbi:hypothetical protein DSO57_1025689 [Entomophthora muscae]|uniref:Uncharacterized protein n=1 Tax=Entomophthora muscae TaxID=34485 RepID=A0ACC2U063_9FUNG|nr:hypothetical protein DSO57_1025689 [Entomophthora muscae]
MEASQQQSSNAAKMCCGCGCPHRVTKLTRNYTKVITTRRVSLIYNPVYCQELVLSAMMEKVKPVLDTSYKPYMSDNKEQDDNKEPHYYQITCSEYRYSPCFDFVFGGLF